MTRVIFTLICVITVVFTTGCGGPKLTPKDRQFLVGQGVQSFREAGLYNIQQALDQFATPAAVRKFEAFDAKIWNFADPKVGWSYFLNTSVVGFGNMEGEKPVVAFYNPWSDVYLLTSWQVDEDGPKIADAEMLMGDFVRKRGKLPFSPSPAWVRTKMFKPAAVGVEAAESIRAFQALYPSKIEGDWRKRIPNLNEPELVDHLNYAGVSLLLATNLAEIDDFTIPEKEESSQLSRLRSETEKFLDAGKSGKLKPVLARATETLPAAQKTLLEIPPEKFSAYQPVSYLLGNDACVVFLAPTDNADYFLSCVTKGKGARQKLVRVDLVSYPVIYRAAPKLLEEASKPS